MKFGLFYQIQVPKPWSEETEAKRFWEALDQIAYAEEMAQLLQRDRSAGEENLHLLLRWWRDLLLTKQELINEVTHLSHRDNLVETARAYSTTDIAGFLSNILEALHNIEKNANSRLTLEVLMLHMPQRQTASLSSGG